MNKVILQDEFFSSMYELETMMEEYVELTQYQLLYEANKPDVSKQMQKNANIKQNSEGVIMKAIHAVQKIIRNIISSIQNFFDELTMGQDEKQLYNQMQEAIRQNPELKNKKLTVKDFRTIEKKYDDMINEVEGEIRTATANHRPPAQEIFDKASEFLKAGLIAGTAILGTEIVVKAARSNLGVAKIIKKKLNDEGVIMKQLEESLGKEEAQKFKKEINKDARLVSGHRLLVNLFAKKYESLRECITDTFGQLHQVSQGKIFGNMRFINRFVKNKHLQPVVKTAAKVGAGVVGSKISNKVQKTAAKAEQWVSKNIVNRGHDPAEKSAIDFMLS